MSWNDIRLELLGPFELSSAGQRLSVPLGAQRLLAYLALQEDGAHRTAVAEQLWLDCTSARAAANLRSALCHARRIDSLGLINSVGQRLALTSSIRVDLHQVQDVARQVITGQRPLPTEADHLIAGLSRELLPGWTEEWLPMERERWGQMRVYALESLAQQFQSAGNYLPALQAALAAIAIDPFRETPHRIAIEVHISEGNVASALRRYQDYRAFLHRELRVAPSRQMAQLVQALMPT
ncbi:BTAD domain-containing putative transcriptional regulator [Streptomyces sp. E2N166]|uniref:AfsR/SARP family transcriptional regulator n=1 Tax=Streptomyces sp. E2N166 TaxID=1851909 RepID=UPI000EF6D3F9|nr:BTAD domain-containing putative transcriptional regulator [Streptomyces sp. E2N166]